MPALPFVLGLMLSVAVSSTAIAQYKYTGPDGRTVYSDQPPPKEARSVQRRDFGAAASSVETSLLPYEVRKAVEDFPVTLITAQQCAPCDQGRQLLRDRGVPFIERTLSTPADLAELAARGLKNNLPLLTIGSKRIEGYESGSWQSTLTSVGYPTTSRLPASYSNPPPTALAPPAPAVSATAPAPANPSAPNPAPSAPQENSAPPAFRF